MASEVRYKSSVERDLKKIDKPTVSRLLSKLEQGLSSNPNAGEVLRGEFRGMFKYRIGDYRIIYTRIPEGVLVLKIRHRRDVYR
ncbi:MAG: type II toxin-antitoxin system RelE/ParE family toxin [Candidatus Omnitrophica bacterium]|nr:type II toxin-antitoxin system RelE/ParE family toxin [Candidatus Omnitrophota bacterium]